MALSGYLKGQIFDIDKECITIGRKEDQDICTVKDTKISRCHCEIRKTAGKYILCDLNSGNGTWYNGQRIETIEIEEGESFTVGDIKFTLLAEAEKVAFFVEDEAPLNMTTVLSADLYGVENDVEVLKQHLQVFEEVSKSLGWKTGYEKFS